MITYRSRSIRRYSSRMVRFAAASAGVPDTAPGSPARSAAGVRIPGGWPGGRLTEKPDTKLARAAASRKASRGADRRERRHLQEHRLADADLVQRLQQRRQAARVVEEPGPVIGVGTAEVQTEVVGPVLQQPDGLDIVGDHRLVRLHRRGGAPVGVDQVDAHGNGTAYRGEPLSDPYRAVVGYSIVDDDRVVARQPEQPGRRVACGPLRRHRADFHVPEPEGGQQRYRPA